MSEYFGIYLAHINPLKNIMKTNLFNASLAILTLWSVSSSVMADAPMLTNEPKRPVALMARDLGIKPEQFIACFKSVQPASQGERPPSDWAHSNKSVLLPCLQKANASITNDKLDAVMDRYRPGGHEAQMPSH
jgi:hypothetical protein